MFNQDHKAPRRLALLQVYVWLVFLSPAVAAFAEEQEQRPNILLAISDDQSYPHTSAYGYTAIRTPAFDRVARMGVLFENAFTPAPGCSPMRAAVLTGRQIWQLEEAGTHASSFPKKFEVFQDRLEGNGYYVGYTGKGWGPGNWRISGRNRNPAGPAFNSHNTSSPEGISGNDYAANFAEFLEQKPEGKSFSFWFGASEPHRRFKKGIGQANGMDPKSADVPAFLPDTPEVRSDILDYCFEIQWFDQHLRQMLQMLEERGELENTLVIVTSDNGMAFPRAKANVYEYGIHMPLAICWPAKVPPGRTVADLVSLIDVTSTIYEATGTEPPARFPLSGKSLLSLLTTRKSGSVEPERQAVYSGRERHSSSRYRTLSYPQRCIRTETYLYIRNFRPERWPAGAPRKYGTGGYASEEEVVNKETGPVHGGYHDIDACPTLDFLIENSEHPELSRFLHLAVDKRPAEELYNTQRDPACLVNLAHNSEYQNIRDKLRQQLIVYLSQTGDPRVIHPDGGDVWETYPRYSPLRWFPTPKWAKDCPEKVPEQPWLQQRKPKGFQEN